MSEEVRRIDRTLIHKGSIIEYYVDTMELPDGKYAKWDFIKHNGAAAVVPVMSDGKILMVSQYRNALERYTLEVPAGGLNPEEATDTAAARELEEETGYASGDLELLLSLRTTVAFCNEKIDIYVAKNLVKTQQHLDEDEYLNVGAYTLTELEELIFDGKIQDSKTIAALMAYKVKYGI